MGWNARQMAILAGAFLLGGPAALAQTADNPTFEVASVRRSRPPGAGERIFFGPPRGGPGTSDPGRITWTRAALRNILMTAYSARTFQVVGPDWLSTERYDIAANVPAGATAEQVPRMWQNLLRERFGVVLHHESRPFQVDLMTVASSGSKLKPTELPPDAEPFTPGAGPPKRDKDGVPEMNGSGAIVTIFVEAGTPTARMTARGLPASDIATRLGQLLRKPVLDRTGLTGRYDFVLEFTPDLRGIPVPSPPLGAEKRGSLGTSPERASEPGTNVASAVEKQLGLKLTAGRENLEVIVVDHADQNPTEN